MSYKTIVHKNYTVEIEEPTLYVDNESRNRSGHMSHALAEFAPNCLIEFNANCSAYRWDGHSAYGWIEYRISRDSAKTYSDIYTLPYSVECFLDGIHTISLEKAVACDDGTIVAFCLRNDATNREATDSWSTPMLVTSSDEGKTWSEAREYTPYAGRTYDAVYHKGSIYLLHWCSEDFIGAKPEDVFRLYRSDDNAQSFYEVCVVPMDTTNRGYGAMLFDAEGRLHVFAYNGSAECEMDHIISDDEGKTWTLQKPCFMKEGCRNPQLALLDGVYILHARANGPNGFVLYTSENLQDWDEGCYIVEKKGAMAYYSNNLNLSDENGNFLLVKYDDTYRGAGVVNGMHTKVRIKK